MDRSPTEMTIDAKKLTLPESQTDVGVDQLLSDLERIRFDRPRKPAPALRKPDTTLVDLQQELTKLRLRDEQHEQSERHRQDELRLARAVQRDLLRSPRPSIRGVDLLTFDRPADIVSGDIHDVARLDASHVSVAVADATGHGFSAALISMFVKRSLRGIELIDGRPHRLDPDDVLTRLNRDLLDASLEDCQFVTATYAIYNEETRELSWSRAGAPYPILIRPHQTPRQLRSDGPLAGLSRESRFEVATCRLELGDTLLFHTDGLESLLLTQKNGLGLGDLPQSDWYRRLDPSATERHLEEIAGRLDTIDPADWSADDITIVSLHLCNHT